MSERKTFAWMMVIFFVFVGGACFLYLKGDSDEQKAQQEALENGIETEAFVIDKNVKSKTTVVSTGLVTSPMSRKVYKLKLYALKNEYEISVSKELYDQVEQGDYLATKVYKDRIILLQEDKGENK